MVEKYWRNLLQMEIALTHPMQKIRALYWAVFFQMLEKIEETDCLDL